MHVSNNNKNMNTNNNKQIAGFFSAEWVLKDDSVSSF